MTLVPADGPVPAEFAVVGEAPASEEVRQGRGFVGPSGALLWPLMRRLALLDRRECYVTNLCKHELDNDLDGDAKLEPGEFETCRTELLDELARVKPRRILAVGALAARALLGERYVSMETCNGIGFAVPQTWQWGWAGNPLSVIVPTWHPAASLRPGGEDRLAYTGAAIAALRNPKLHTAVRMIPEAWRWMGVSKSMPYILSPLADGRIGLDTEGTPDDPICMTAANDHQRCYVEPVDVPGFFAALPPHVRLRFHNALWDWPVLKAMGAPRDLHTRWEWADTMELAYLRQTEPRGLKDLAYRHLGLRMRTFDDVVRPHYEAMLVAAAQGTVDAHSTLHTLSPKGRKLKKPKLVVADAAKPLKRALGNPKLLAERMPWMPPMSLRYVPERERVEYATMDAWATVMIEEALR